MPALPPAASVLRVILRYTWGSDTDVINRFFLRYSGTAPTSAQLTPWATLIGTSWATNLAPLAAANLTLTQVEVTDLTSDTAGQAIVTVSHVGSNASSALAAGTATLMNFGIDRRYRGGKPRLYLPYGAQADVLSPQLWVPSWPTSVLNAWNAFLIEMNGTPPGQATIAAQVNVSYYYPDPNPAHVLPNGDVPSIVRPDAAQVDPITSTHVSQVFASQRRRQRA